MKQVTAKLFLVTAAFCFSLVPTAFATDVKVGTAAPAFTLTDSEGKEHALSQYKGKTVVLEWVNFKCPYVRKHYDTRNMQGLQEKYIKDGVVWLAINSSAPGKQGYLDAEAAKAALKEEGSSPSAFLHDPEGTVGKLYGARTTPHMYIIDAKGTLVYAGAIDDDSSSRHQAVKTSKNYVATALDNLKQDTPVEVASTEPYGCSVKYAS
jgi:peroxiredoxin